GGPGDPARGGVPPQRHRAAGRRRAPRQSGGDRMSPAPSAALVEAPQLPGWDHICSGKVRELYVPAGQDPATAIEGLVVATDRISAYDHSLQPGIPDKGRLLTGISSFWFEQLADLVDHHVISATDVPDAVTGRALLCRGLDMVALECVARGYLTGSGLADYRAGGSVGGHVLPAGLTEASRLDPAIFTPSTKAAAGEHDENITVGQARGRLGDQLVDQLETLTLAIYERARALAE